MRRISFVFILLMVGFIKNAWAIQFDMIDYFQVENLSTQVSGIAVNQGELFVRTQRYVSNTWLNEIVVINPNTHQVNRTLTIPNAPTQWFGGLDYYANNLVLGTDRHYDFINPDNGTLVSSFSIPLPPPPYPLYGRNNDRVFSLANDGSYLLSATQGFNMVGDGVTYLNMFNSAGVNERSFQLYDDPKYNDQFMGIGVYQGNLLAMGNLNNGFYYLDYLNGGNLIDQGTLPFYLRGVSGMAIEGEDIYILDSNGMIVRLNEGSGYVLPGYPLQDSNMGGNNGANAVPEPSTLFLFGIVGVGLALRRRFQKNA